ncbi:MAG: anthranilate synthase component I family protein [Thermodesulfobacteriota bacterium]
MDLTAVIRERLADTETPVSTYVKLCRDEEDAFLLESAESHEGPGRWSIIAYDPLASLELWPGRVERGGPAGRETFPEREFYNLVRRTLADHYIEGPPGLPGVGALLGFIGYDAVRLIEDLGPLRPAGPPVARLVFPSRFVLFDHWRRTLFLAALAAGPAEGRDKIAEMARRLEYPFRLERRYGGLEIHPPDRDRYLAVVRRAQEYIRAGEIFQVVLADRFTGRTRAAPFDVYRRLRVQNPSPYMFFLNFGAYALLGASPETLVKVSGGRVIIRPIAGTRGRSSDPEKDAALERELLASEKERAEHVMLVDLGRNDAGRVSRFGTVKVDPYMSVERYSHVMHLVSQVQGRLREDMDAVHAFQAGFPAGTVTGAPKVRAMQIIDELESTPRGPYGGAVGWFGAGNEMDTCLAIRMVLFQGDNFNVPVGAGIVADSDPASEYREILNKAAGSLAALEAAAKEES